MTKSPKRPITFVPPPEDLVKRRLLKNTDMRNDESVTKVDENMLNVVDALTKDETPCKRQIQTTTRWPKLTVLDDHEEMMKGRQKELNSLKKMGAMTVAKRSEAVGKSAIRTRLVDREKDGRVKPRLVLKDYNDVRSAHSPRCFHQHRGHCPLETMLAASSHDRNSDPESDHITIAIDVDTPFLHAGVDQDLFAETPEPDEWYECRTERRRSVETERSIVRLTQSTRVSWKV